mgnify:CR=1 FL=1
MPEVRAKNLNNLTMRYLTLNPVNSNNSGYSFRSGLPLIRFDIAATQAPMLMDGKNLRINGRITYRKAAGGKLVNTETNFVDNYAGLFGNAIQNVTIASKRLNQTLERVTAYNRMLPSIVSQVNNAKYIDTALSHGGKHSGTIPQMRHAINKYHAFDNNGNSVADGSQTGVDFSAPLYCGMLQTGEDIDLSSVTGVGGLTLELLLNSDSTGSCFGTDAAGNSVTYTLSDLTLTVPVYEMGGESASNYAGQVNQYSFNSWSSMFQTLNSSASVVAFTPGLSKVTSCLQNFITSTDLGNQLFNGARLGSVGQIQQCRFSKNGMLYPLQFRLQSVSQSNDNSARPFPAVDQSVHTYKVNAEWFRNALEGVSTRKVARVKNTAVNWNDWAAGVVNKGQNAGRDGITPGSAFTQAILFDAFGGGVDFSQEVFSFELKTSATNELLRGVANGGGVIGASANNLDGTSATAQAVYLYFLNQNTIMYSPQGIELQR